MCIYLLSLRGDGGIHDLEVHLPHDHLVLEEQASQDAGVACGIRPHFSNVGIRVDRGKDDRCGGYVDNGGGGVEHPFIHLHHVLMVVDQLALEGEDLVVESGIAVGQGVHSVHEVM